MPKVFYSVIFAFLILVSTSIFAETASTTDDELKSKIEDRNKQIKQLEEEIKQYNVEVDNASKEAKTLQSTIKTLDLTKKKITTDISLTNKKIDKTNLTIQQLGLDIASTSKSINKNREALAQMIRLIETADSSNFMLAVLSSKNLGEVWTDIENVKNLQEQVALRTQELKELKTQKESKQNQTESQKKQLVNLKGDLSGKKIAVESTAKEKSTLLTQTKNKESAFRELIKTKEELKEQFEKELYEYESKLNISIDKGSYPSPKHGILSWPLEDVYITQLFGKTSASARLYASGSHNGVDFRASIGTPVKAVMEGIVAGTGNTDIYPGCYSFGKWLMIKHPNGLSTIYGHLSSIKVSSGDSVGLGDTIGYSGNTGYTTGPHLHMSLYATQGVRIEKYVSSRGCKQAVIPLADTKAYLDPMTYFPNL